MSSGNCHEHSCGKTEICPLRGGGDDDIMTTFTPWGPIIITSSSSQPPSISFPCGGGLEYLLRCPASRKRRQKGNTVSDETVMYGYWSSVTGLDLQRRLNKFPVRYELNSYIRYSRKISLFPVWRRVRIPPPESLRVVRGDIKGTQCPGV
jgi:hypothetical protein